MLFHSAAENNDSDEVRKLFDLMVTDTEDGRPIAMALARRNANTKETFIYHLLNTDITNDTAHILQTLNARLAQANPGYPTRLIRDAGSHLLTIIGDRKGFTDDPNALASVKRELRKYAGSIGYPLGRKLPALHLCPQWRNR